MTDKADALTLAAACVDTMLESDAASRNLGMEVVIPAAGQADVTMTVSDTMVNGFDLCHGGYIFTLADSAFAFSCNAYNQLTVAAGASIEFLAPAYRGDQLLASAREVGRAGRSGVYDVRITNQHDEIIALFRGKSRTLNKTILPA